MDTTPNIEPDDIDNNKEPAAWETCVKTMLEDGISPGKTYTSAWLSDQLGIAEGHMTFGLAVSAVRRALEEHGYYLDGRGGKGKSFTVIAYEDNESVAARRERMVTDLLIRSKTLLGATPTHSLKDMERKKHESRLNIVSVKLLLVRKAKEAYARFLGGENKKLPDMPKKQPE